jgi:hypothetical protein
MTSLPLSCSELYILSASSSAVTSMLCTYPGCPLHLHGWQIVSLGGGPLLHSISGVYAALYTRHYRPPLPDGWPTPELIGTSPSPFSGTSRKCYDDTTRAAVYKGRDPSYFFGPIP